MILNRVKLGRAVPFIKYLASVVSLIFLPETLIWNKFNFGYQIYEGVHLTLPPHIFFHPSEIWSMLHHGSVGASSE